MSPTWDFDNIQPILHHGTGNRPGGTLDIDYSMTRMCLPGDASTSSTIGV
jgi:hypothetical protein